jgi:hypothetical protein
MWILYIKRHDREYMTVGTYNSYDPKVEYEPPAFDKIASALGAVLTLGAFGSPQ